MLRLACSGVVGTGRCSCHKPVVVQVPASTVVLLCATVTVDLVKIAWHPALHSWPMEIRELEVRSGRICACLAERGRDSKLSVVVWMEVIVLSLGRVMVVGCTAGIVVELCGQNI